MEADTAIRTPPPARALGPDTGPIVSRGGSRRGWRGWTPRYRDHYAWYALISAIDVMLTGLVIEEFAAAEVNRVAAWFFDSFGSLGLGVLKLMTVAVVVAVCERVARASPATARRLAEWAVAVSCIPVAVALAQIALIGVGWVPDVSGRVPRETEIYVPTVRPRVLQPEGALNPPDANSEGSLEGR